MKNIDLYVNGSLRFTAPSLLLIFLGFMLLSFQLRANLQNPQILAPRLSYVDTNIGLDQNTINDIHVDKQGFVWLGTDEGLNRFDGVKVLQILGPKLELSGNSIFHIFEHSNGLLYLSTLNDGILSFDRETQKFEIVLKKQHAFVKQWVQSSDDIIQMSNGNIIIALYEQVYEHNIKTKKNTLLFQLPDEAKRNNQGVRSVYLHNDILVVGTVNGLLAHNLNTNTTYDLYEGFDFSSEARDVKYLHSFDAESLIIGSVEGLYAIPLGEISKVVDDSWTVSKPRVIDPNRNIWDIAIYDKSKAFVATDIGLFELDLETFEFTHLFQPRKKLELLSGLTIVDLAVDRYGNVWMATPKSGAMYWPPSSLLFNNVYNSVFTPKEKLLSSNSIWSMYQHDANTVYIATSNGLNKYSINTGNSERFYVNKLGSPQYTESVIHSLAPSTRQFLWLATAGGMRKFDVTTQQNVPFDKMTQEIQTLFSEYVFDFQIINDDSLWLITNNGVFIVDLQNQIVSRVDTEKNGLPIISISKFLGIDTRTNSLIVAASTSLWSIEIDTLAIKKIHSTEKASQTIYAGGWVRGRNNTFWVTYPAHGLYKLDGDTFKVLEFYNLENHLPTNLIYGLMFDNDGDLWFSSHSGIHVLNVATNNVQSFSFINGLAQSEFNEDAYTQLSDGRFVYGGYLGFSIFNPLKMKFFNEKLTGRTSITEIDLSSRKLELPLTSLNGQTIDLHHDDVGITLYFSSLNFDLLSRTRFQYRIIHNGEAINYPSIEVNKISLPLLSPGKHIIEVFPPGTTNKDDIASLTINVSYPPFASPLAYTCYVILFVVFVGFVFYRQHKIQLVAQQANEKITADNKRLNDALLASNTNTWEWDSQSQLIRCERITTDFQDISKGEVCSTNSDVMHIDDYIKLIHKLDRASYKSKWNAFISRQQKTFDISYRIPNKNGKHLWYRDVGSCDIDDSVVRVKGTYTTLHSSEVSQEKLKLFGKAFTHTRDWVLIFNKDKILIATNPAFHKAFGVERDQINNDKQTSLMMEHQETLYRTVKTLGTMQAGQYKKVEHTIKLAGKKIKLLSAYNAIAEPNNPNEIDCYLIIASDITEQKNVQKELQKLASYDVLTGLLNHTLLIERLKQSIHFAEKQSTQLAVVMIGLNNFKVVNDKYGHIAGDAVLSEIARRLQEKFKDHHTIGRVGGDQFVLVLEENVEVHGVNSIVLSVLKAIEMPITVDQQYLKVTACAGISMYPNDADDAEHLLGKADVAMHAAKQNADDQFCHFSNVTK